MGNGLELLRTLAFVSVLFAALVSVSLPVLYLSFAWYGSRLGRLYMAQSVLSALAFITLASFRFFDAKQIVYPLLATIVVFSLITVINLYMLRFMWGTKRSIGDSNDRRSDDNVGQHH